MDFLVLVYLVLAIFLISGGVITTIISGTMSDPELARNGLKMMTFGVFWPLAVVYYLFRAIAIAIRWP